MTMIIDTWKLPRDISLHKNFISVHLIKVLIHLIFVAARGICLSRTHFVCSQRKMHMEVIAVTWPTLASCTTIHAWFPPEDVTCQSCSGKSCNHRNSYPQFMVTNWELRSNIVDCATCVQCLGRWIRRRGPPLEFSKKWPCILWAV